MLQPRRLKLFYGSQYDRGLDILLALWPAIRERHPSATLDVCSGWDLFDVVNSNVPERTAWKDEVCRLMTQPGIAHHGRAGTEELARIRVACGVWAYPTYFYETNCITGLECQRDGLVPVVAALGALSETVQAGVKVAGDIREAATQAAYLEALFQVMDDERLWQAESGKAMAFARSFSWDQVAADWEAHFS